MRILLYTDGSCYNTGIGGWAFVVVFPDEEGEWVAVIGSGATETTTSNRMELTAIIKGVEYITKIYPHCTSIDVYSDSKLTVDGATKWLDRWVEKGWKNAHRKPVKNQDLWEEWIRTRDAFKGEISLNWIKAHNGDKYNEIADKAASKARCSS